MKRMSRREFTKLAGGAAVVTPLAPALAWTQEKKTEPPKPIEAQSPAEAKPEPKLKLTAKQEEDLKQALERRDRQLSGLRGRTLPYDLEPAFVFQPRTRPRAARKSQ